VYVNRAKEGRINGPKLTLVVGTLGTTVEVLASVLGNPDVVAGLVVEVLDVLLEPINGNIIPMEGQEATISTNLKVIKKDSLVGTVGLRVSPLDTDPLEIEDPLETRWRRGSSGTSESDTLLPDGQVVVHPVTNGILRRDVGLSRLIGLVEEESRLDGSRPAVLERVPVTELVRTPKHGYVF